jgi:hypothetical protein
MSILTEYPVWLIILCLLLGAGYAFLLYYKNRNIDYGKRPRNVMFALRGLVITLIAMLLLAPMIKSTRKTTEKPVIIFAVDNSESLLLTKDSAYYKNDFGKEVNKLVHSLGNKYVTEVYYFGEKNTPINSSEEDIALDFKDKNTNISAIFDEISGVYAFQNVGALVLLTDGIYNQGSNPYYKAQQVKFPVHTVGLGNPEMQTDLSIAGINHNSKTFKGNLFPVEVKVAATQLAGKRTMLTVADKEKTLFTKEIYISGKQHFETVKLFIEAKATGIYKYTVSLSEVDGEITTQNNHATFFVEIVDTREKIGILYHAPHPDISAISQAIETSEKYQVETFAVSDFQGDINKYSLLILHQLPSRTQPASTLIEKARKAGTPILFILGQESNLSAFNTLDAGVKVNQSKNLFNDAVPAYNSNFSSFTFSDETKQMLPKFPPLHTFFGNYQTSGGTNIFMYQKISNVETQYPLITFGDNHGVRTGVIAGDGLWQWRIYNYLYEQNHDAFNEIINKTVLYLSVKSDRSQFRVQGPTIVNENEAVEFNAEVYNDSYELITEPEVTMTVTSEDNKKYTAIFSKQNNGYHLNMGRLPAGDYKWTASTEFGGKKHSKAGLFTVREVMVEAVNLTADHQLLQNIAQTSGGKFFTKDNLQEVEQAIKNDRNITTIATYEKDFNLLMNSWIYFAILILLMGAEWFMRKWGGGY